MILNSTFVRSLVAAAVLGSSYALLPSFAGPPSPGALQQNGQQNGQQDGDDTKLGHVMEGLRGQAKAGGKAIEAKDAAAAWTAVCGMQAKILEAKQETPATAEGKPAADRPAFVNAFRAKLSELLKATCDLEADVLAGKLDDATAKLRTITGPMQKAGHKEFRKD
jgi:soluble cytochrome b562